MGQFRFCDFTQPTCPAAHPDRRPTKDLAFRPVNDPAFCYSTIPAEFNNRRLTNSRLNGRSAWNGQWKIVIPAYTLSANETNGLTRLAASVKDIQLFLRTYSHSGN